MMADIHARMVDILGSLDAVPKTRTVGGAGGGYKFRGIDDIINALNPLLTAAGVYMRPCVVGRDARYTERTNSNGNTVEWCRVAVQVEFHFVAASDGSEVVVVTAGEGLDNSDKATNKAMSAALKYCLLQTFAIATEDMEDSDRERPTVEHRAEPPAQTFRQRVDPETGEIHATAQAGGSAVSTHERPAGQSTGPNPGEMNAIKQWVTTNGGWTNAAILDALDTSAAAIGEHGPEVAIDAWWAAQDKPSVPAFKQAVQAAAKALGGAA